MTDAEQLRAQLEAAWDHLDGQWGAVVRRRSHTVLRRTPDDVLRAILAHETLRIRALTEGEQIGVI